MLFRNEGDRGGNRISLPFPGNPFSLNWSSAGMNTGSFSCSLLLPILNHQSNFKHVRIL